MKVLKRALIFLLLFAGLLWLTLRQEQYNTEFTWRSSLWADAAGYYVYQPALFIYGFNADDFPPKTDSLCGEGFFLKNGKVFTKYTCGVAMLQSPFFLAVHAFDSADYPAYRGFSGIYQKIPAIASAFYCSLALLFLFAFLRFYFSPLLSAAVVAIAYLGTNIYFLSVYSNGGSHVYSFALFAAFLYLTKIITDENKKPRISHLVAWSFVIAFILLIRPLNLLFLVPAAFIDCHSLQSFRQRLRFFIQPKLILILAVAVAITFFPQLLYWKHISGNWIYYSYQNESFSNWKSPQFARLLFSPNNGLLPYNPVYFIIVTALVMMSVKKVVNGLSLLLAFCLLVYLSASWHAVTFGCGFGSRNFSEYAALFALPVGWLFEGIRKFSTRKAVLVFLTLFCVLVNQKATYSYDRCFCCKDWDYDEYFKELVRGSHHRKFIISENGVFGRNKEYSESYTLKPGRQFSSFRKARITTNVKLYNYNTEAAILLEIKSKNDSTILWKAASIGQYLNRIDTMQRLTIYYPLPDSFDTDAKFVVSVWNNKRDSLVVKDIDVYLF